MKANQQITKSGPAKGGVAEAPVMEADKELTPKAEAKKSNQLPKAKQWENFEEDLEEHDPGNQPA